MIKNLFKARGFRVWLIVSVVLIAVFTVVTVLASAVYFDIICRVMPGGGLRAVYAEGVEPIFTPDEGISTKADAYRVAREFNEELAGEGFVLLKNEEGALPLATPVSDPDVSARPKISIFGKNSVNIAYGGSGSGGANTADCVDLYTALTDAGYDCNTTLKNFYEDTNASGPVRVGNSSDLDSGDTVVLSTAETPQSMYTDAVKSSYAEFSDMALVVITRIGGEGWDIPRLMTGATGYRNEDDHFLQLDANEEDLIAAVCEAGFGRVVVVINSGSAMELGFLESDSPYVTDKGYEIDPDKIDAAVWMGYPGMTGTNALASILSGEVNPSGRLPDTYATDFKKDPTWENFGDNRITANADSKIVGGDQYTLGGYEGVQSYYFVDYEESVYVGYKYYETRGVTDGEEWYEDNVVYPFGYGMSYTRFTWTIEDASSINNVAISGSEKYTVQVRVKNDGNVAGKEVIQLYAHAPYTEGKIEKPEVTLVDFAKTGLLQPEEEEVVTLTFDPYYLASYDYNDANDNDFSGYELDAGDYSLYVSADAHDRSTAIPFRVASGIKYKSDPVTGYKVQNLYTDCEDSRFDSATQLSDVTVDGETRKGLSRSDWTGTWPTTPTDDERTVDRDFISALQDTRHNNPGNFDDIIMPVTGSGGDMTLRDLLFEEDGSYHDHDGDGIPSVAYDDKRWEALMDQADIAEMINFYDYAGYQTRAVDSIGMPRTNDSDGPVGWVCFMDNGVYYDTCSYCAEVVVAATFNKDMARAFGNSVGNEALFGNERGDGMPYSGWYSPGVNIHRSPFGGRNFEYYSEDPVLSGKMATETYKGCMSKGVYPYIKHFALNDSEIYRTNNICIWANEQAIRELYLKPFETAIKEAEVTLKYIADDKGTVAEKTIGATAIMSSFNRLGTTWAGGHYGLMTEVLRGEWGFEGVALSDFNLYEYTDVDQAVRAGTNLNLNLVGIPFADEKSDTAVSVMREAIHAMSYAVVNSNRMQGVTPGSTFIYHLAGWQMGFIALAICLYVAAAALTVWIIVRAVRGRKRGTDDKR